MTRSRLAAEAEAVAWIERTKGGARAADVIEAMLAELRRLWAMEDELEELRGGRYVIGPPVNEQKVSVPA